MQRTQQLKKNGTCSDVNLIEARLKRIYTVWFHVYESKDKKTNLAIDVRIVVTKNKVKLDEHRGAWEVGNANLGGSYTMAVHASDHLLTHKMRALYTLLYACDTSAKMAQVVTSRKARVCLPQPSGN